MRRLSRFLLAVFCCALATPAWPDPAGGEGGESGLAFVGVRVLAGDGRRLIEDQTVVVIGSEIVSVGARSTTDIPAGVAVLDGADRVLVPGLVDAHVHLRNASPEALQTYLLAGITTIREMNGRPFLLEWRQRILSGEVSGPRLIVAAPTLGNFSSPREGYPTPTSAAEGEAVVRAFHDAGYDWIKVYSFLGADAFEGVMRAARALDMPVGGHVPLEVGLEGTFESGMRSIEHLTEYVGASLTPEAAELDAGDHRSIFGAGELDSATIARFVRKTAELRVWNVPSLVWFDHRPGASVAEAAWSDAALRSQGERNRRHIVGLLHEAGAPLALGTDSDAGDDEPASSIHDELAAMVESGLSPGEALRAATSGGADLLGLSEVIGEVAPGRRADLLLLACDPLMRIECTRRIEMVVAAGRIVAPAE